MISKDTLFMCVYIHNNRHCPSVKKYFYSDLFYKLSQEPRTSGRKLQLLKEKDVNKVYNKKKKRKLSS